MSHQTGLKDMKDGACLRAYVLVADQRLFGEELGSPANYIKVAQTMKEDADIMREVTKEPQEV